MFWDCVWNSKVSKKEHICILLLRIVRPPQVNDERSWKRWHHACDPASYWMNLMKTERVLKQSVLHFSAVFSRRHVIPLSVPFTSITESEEGKAFNAPDVSRAEDSWPRPGSRDSQLNPLQTTTGWKLDTFSISRTDSDVLTHARWDWSSVNTIHAGDSYESSFPFVIIKKYFICHGCRVSCS